MSINKVKLELKEVKQKPEVIATPESMGIKGVQLDSALYCLENGKVEIFLINKKHYT